MRWLVFIMSLALLSVISIWARADKAWASKLRYAVTQITIAVDAIEQHEGTVFNLNLGKHSVFITNAHVCSSYAFMYIHDRLHRVIKRDFKHDLCALQSDLPGGLAMSKQALEYDARAGRLPKALTVGFIDNPQEAHAEVGAVFSRVFFGRVVEGNSGSPVFNTQLEVIGVIFATMPNMAEPMGLFIDLATLKEFTKNL